MQDGLVSHGGERSARGGDTASKEMLPCFGGPAPSLRGFWPHWLAGLPKGGPSPLCSRPHTYFEDRLNGGYNACVHGTPFSRLHARARPRYLYRVPQGSMGPHSFHPHTYLRTRCAKEYTLRAACMCGLFSHSRARVGTPDFFPSGPAPPILRRTCLGYISV